MASRTSNKKRLADRFRITSLAELDKWGRAFARLLQPGDVIALIGPLGAGKTTLVQSVAKGLGYQGSVSSPTFALANEYALRRGAVYHMDMYRLSPAELQQFPLEDYWGSGICLIEWADRVRDRWPADTVAIQLTIESPETRSLQFGRLTPSWARRLAPLRKLSRAARS